MDQKPLVEKMFVRARLKYIDLKGPYNNLGVNRSQIMSSWA